jgi:hypothetical protein
VDLRQAAIKGMPFTPEGAEHRTIPARQLRTVLSDGWQPEEARARPIRPARARAPSALRGSSRTARVEIDGGARQAITLEVDADGVIDLSHMAGPSNGPLPPLILRNCIVQGELRIAGSRFSFLCLENCVLTALDAHGCRIDGGCQLIGLRVTRFVDLSDVQVTGTVRIVGAEMDRIALRGARVDGSVYLSELLFTGNDADTQLAFQAMAGDTPLLDLRGATSTDTVSLRKLRLRKASISGPGDPVQGLFDLRNMTCRTFADDDADAWSGLGNRSRWRLLLDGISFEGFDRSDRPVDETDLSAVEAGRPFPLLSSGPRLAMLTAFAPPIEGVGRYSKLVRTPMYTAQPFAVFAQAYTRSELRGRATEVATEQIRLRWAAASLIIGQRIRQKWLSVAVVCLSLSVIWSAISNFDVHGILSGEALKAQLPSFAKVAAGLGAVGLAALWFSHVIVRLIGLLFDKVFAFGLRPQRAVFALTIYLLLGIGITQLAVDRGALLLSAEIGEGRARRGTPVPGEGSQSDRTVATLHQISAESCNQASHNRADQFVYAIDVIVPVDLRQECSFSFPPGNGPGWRLAKTIYALVGWVIISLTFLSLTGVLRRDIEA